MPRYVFDFNLTQRSKLTRLAQELQLADVNNKHQDIERKIAELRSVMSSMARPPTERVALPPAVENTVMAT